MADLLKNLEEISAKLDKWEANFDRETSLWEQERKERERLGITDEKEAYKHYLAFMKAHGYDYEAEDRAKQAKEKK